MRVFLAKLQKKYKHWAAVFLLIVVSVTATAGVMAAIPHSTSGVISACRNTFTGALKAIDTQSGAGCGVFETPLNWNSHQSGVVFFEHMPSSPGSDFYGSYNPAKSRNVTSVKAVLPAEDTAGGGIGGFCVDLPFAPLVAVSDAGADITSYYAAKGDGSVTSYCGAGYDFYIAGPTVANGGWYVTN